MKITEIKPDTRVQFAVDVDFPVCNYEENVEAGALGTITDVDPCYVWVKLDKHSPGLDEWDNRVCFDIYAMDGGPADLAALVAASLDIYAP